METENEDNGELNTLSHIGTNSQNTNFTENWYQNGRNVIDNAENPIETPSSKSYESDLQHMDDLLKKYQMHVMDVPQESTLR